jgi:hypothetical protein
VYVKLFVIHVKYSIAEHMAAVEKDVKKKFYIEHCSELRARFPGINSAYRISSMSDGGKNRKCSLLENMVLKLGRFGQ